MFVDQTIKKNKKLLETAFALHQKGEIMPDSYVIDMDALLDNSKKILDEAKKQNMKLFFMLKQLGRNPYIAKKLVEMGYEGAVVVDFKEAKAMMNAGIPIGNIGHLVQIPDAMIPEVVKYKPEVITVYSLKKVEQIQKAAESLGVTQGILLRVYDEGDMVYKGQTAGFLLRDLRDVAKTILDKYPNVKIKGVTSFPCYLYDEKVQDIQPTHNLNTVKRSVEILRELNVKAEIINTPSATCVRTLQKMAAWGGNCGEPGHGLTGTTPMHAVYDLEETPCVVYVSEVSHNFGGMSYCYGGGYYRRSHMRWALVGKELSSARRLEVVPPSLESIDYHIGITKECDIGDTVIMAFRFQIFVTRSDVVLVKGIQSGKPEIIGIYDSMGRIK